MPDPGFCGTSERTNPSCGAGVKPSDAEVVRSLGLRVRRNDLSAGDLRSDCKEGSG